MRQNYKGNKKRIEESKRKKKEEKRNKRLAARKDENAAPMEGAPIIAPEAGAPSVE